MSPYISKKAAAKTSPHFYSFDLQIVNYRILYLCISNLFSLNIFRDFHFIHSLKI